MSNKRIPPHDEVAEESILGSILIDRNSLTLIADTLKPEHFYGPSRAQIYQAMVELYQEREPIDIVTLTDKLKKLNIHKQAGGSAYLAKLAEQVPTSANVQAYAKIVKDAAIKRRLITLSGEFNNWAFDESRPLEEVLDHVENEVFSLSQQHVKKGFIHVRDALADSFDRLDELHKSDGEMRGVSTGLKPLDNVLSGMQASNLIILAARPGTGKTAFSLSVARHVAVEKKEPVGFFSLEMSKEELIDRLLVAQANIDSWKLKTGRLGTQEYARISDAMGVLADSPIYIDDTPGMSILEMRTKARRLASEFGLKLLIMDYITLARPSRPMESRVLEVGDISMGLKNLAKELKIPVIALSQLNRSVEHRGGNRPQLSDLRDSGSIEQDADVVMFLYRDNDEDLEAVKLNVAKHRNGPVATIDLRFVGSKMQYFAIDDFHQPQPDAPPVPASPK